MYTKNIFIFTDPWLIPSFQARSSHWTLLRRIYLDSSNMWPSQGGLWRAFQRDDHKARETDSIHQTVWHPAHAILQRLPNLEAVEIYISRRECDVSIESPYWDTSDFREVESMITTYFPNARCRQPIKGLELNLAIQCPDSAEVANYIARLSRELRASRFRCTIRMGGICGEKTANEKRG